MRHAAVFRRMSLPEQMLLDTVEGAGSETALVVEKLQDNSPTAAGQAGNL